jgi:thiamine-monophosphate kinase
MESGYNLGVKLSELGEFGLIDLLAEIVGAPQTADVLVGIGDDAACWWVEDGVQLATMDSMVEDVHFNLSTTTWRELGWKALAVNLSDIAAMGGNPRFALVSLGLPADTDVADIEELYRGMAELARAFNIVIVGGDVVKAPVVMMTVAVTGISRVDQVLTRDAAVPGQLVAVTGNLGASAAGRAVLQGRIELDGRAVLRNDIEPSEEIAAVLREAHLKPNPRVGEGQALVRCGVKAAIDISDGLVSDLKKLCKSSGVGARIYTSQVPVQPMMAESFGDDAIMLALSGGEDYELLFAASQDTIGKVRGEMLCPVTAIGEITAEPGVEVLDGAGNQIAIGVGGWDHFTSGE